VSQTESLGEEHRSLGKHPVWNRSRVSLIDLRSSGNKVCGEIDSSQGGSNSDDSSSESDSFDEMFSSPSKIESDFKYSKNESGGSSKMLG
jgi:hypothetical protein